MCVCVCVCVHQQSYSNYKQQQTKMSLPKTYKQAVFKEAGAPLTVEEAELTPPSKGEVLVKVEACGVCFSDMFAQQNIMGGGL